MEEKCNVCLEYHNCTPHKCNSAQILLDRLIELKVPQSERCCEILWGLNGATIKDFRHPAVFCENIYFDKYNESYKGIYKCQLNNKECIGTCAEYKGR